MLTWLQYSVRPLLKGKDGSRSGWEVNAKVCFFGIVLVQNAVLAFTTLVIMWCLHMRFGQFCESKALRSHSTICAHSCSVFVKVKIQWLLRRRWALIVHDCERGLLSVHGCGSFADHFILSGQFLSNCFSLLVTLLLGDVLLNEYSFWSVGYTSVSRIGLRHPLEYAGLFVSSLSSFLASDRNIS